jgi:hypothetical protein
MRQDTFAQCGPSQFCILHHIFLGRSNEGDEMVGTCSTRRRDKKF